MAVESDLKQQNAMNRSEVQMFADYVVDNRAGQHTLGETSLKQSMGEQSIKTEFLSKLSKNEFSTIKKV